jgi:DNA-binding transcriptional LysR family regulator
MTRQISLLEEEVGVKLFVRTTRSVSLTEAGKICRDEFSKLEFAFEEAINRIKNTVHNNVSTVNIGFYFFFSRTHIIAPIMEYLYAQFPDINFTINLYDFRVLRHNLLDGKIDLCVAVSSDWQYWPLVKVIVLRQQPFKLVISSKHPLASAKQLNIENLAGQTWLTSKTLEILRPYTSNWSQQIPHKAKIPVEDYMTMLAYIEAGRGFSCQPPVFQGVDSGTLKLYPLPFDDAILDFICAYRENMMNPLVLAVVKHIHDHFGIPLR